MCVPSPYKTSGDESVKTTKVSLEQNIINGTADQEDDSTTTTTAESAYDTGTNVGIVILFIFKCD